MDDTQRTEVARVFNHTKNAGLLDYVACWYRKAAEVMAVNPAIPTAFVSTNSITQGEQAGVLWPDLFKLGVKLHFAHRTFAWSSEARGKAAVHCVIIGFGLQEASEKWLYDYETPKSVSHAVQATNINPYLVDGPDVILVNRSKPLCNVPEMGIGNKPIDGGHYLFTPDEKAEFLVREPKAKKWFRRWMGATEFLNGYERWYLWLGDCPPDELRRLPEVMKRVESVRRFRLDSPSEPTRRLSKTPLHFHVENIPDRAYLLIPCHSSETRAFIPMGFISPKTLCGNANLMIRDANLLMFGIMQSTQHMAWVRAVCGRLKSDYRYSAGIVYNNFPWPEPTDKQRTAIEQAAQGVLDARAQFPGSSLADLYDPLAMPPPLVKAHQTLDRAVDVAYGKTSFQSEAERVAFLFGLYEKLTSMFPMEKKVGRRRRR